MEDLWIKRPFPRTRATSLDGTHSMCTFLGLPPTAKRNFKQRQSAVEGTHRIAPQTSRTFPGTLLEPLPWSVHVDHTAILALAAPWAVPVKMGAIFLRRHAASGRWERRLEWPGQRFSTTAAATPIGSAQQQLPRWKSASKRGTCALQDRTRPFDGRTGPSAASRPLHCPLAPFLPAVSGAGTPCQHAEDNMECGVIMRLSQRHAKTAVRITVTTGITLSLTTSWCRRFLLATTHSPGAGTVRLTTRFGATARTLPCDRLFQIHAAVSLICEQEQHARFWGQKIDSLHCGTGASATQPAKPTKPWSNSRAFTKPARP